MTLPVYQKQHDPYSEPLHNTSSQQFTLLTDSEFFFFVRRSREDLLAAYIELKRYCRNGKDTCHPLIEKQARETWKDPGTIRRRIDALVEVGAIAVWIVGREKHYRLLLVNPPEGAPSPVNKPFKRRKKYKALSLNARFLVMQRDRFTCQYCGAKAPDVALQVDHKIPCSRGGVDDMENLITSCQGCNAGKHDRPLMTGVNDHA